MTSLTETQETTNTQQVQEDDSALSSNKHMPRATRQRNAIKTAFLKARLDDRILAPHEAHGIALACGDAPNLGIATVYRNLKALVDCGELRAIKIPGEADRYQSTNEPAPTTLYMMLDGTVRTSRPRGGQDDRFAQFTYNIER